VFFLPTLFVIANWKKIPQFGVLFFIILTVLTLFFNGILTSLPIVIYDNSYNLGLRIFSIPLEDFIYGYLLISWSIWRYEKIYSSSTLHLQES
jgi:lycopene cyclase domain-containing protein